MNVVGVQTQLDLAIQAAAPGPGWFLAGWVVVAEWVPPEGERVLSRLNSADLTPWARTGYLYDALEGEDWTPDEDD